MTTPAYRERRRRAKLRRRARDRDVSAAVASLGLTHRACRWLCRNTDARWMALDFGRRHGWWSTPEGRAGWTAADIKAKRARSVWRNETEPDFVARMNRENFRCAMCGFVKPAALGCADKRPDLCDGCWVVFHEVRTEDMTPGELHVLASYVFRLTQGDVYKPVGVPS